MRLRGGTSRTSQWLMIGLYRQSYISNHLQGGSQVDQQILRLPIHYRLMDLLVHLLWLADLVQGVDGRN